MNPRRQTQFEEKSDVKKQEPCYKFDTKPGATNQLLRISEYRFINPNAKHRKAYISEPSYHSIIEPAIRTAKDYILSLPDDWDDQGSPHFESKTFDRVATFLRIHAERLMSQHGTKIDRCQILPGPRGAIDVLWKTYNYEFAITFEPDNPNEIKFYADDLGRSKSCIKGIFCSDQDVTHIFLFLMGI